LWVAGDGQGVVLKDSKKGKGLNHLEKEPKKDWEKKEGQK